MRSVKTAIIVVVSLAIAGFALNAFARGGMGWGGAWGHHWPGWHHRGFYGSGSYDRVSNDEDRQYEQNREAFLEETEELRTQLSENEHQLQNELAKDEPDASKASALQKVISDLQAQLDQKRIEYRVENEQRDWGPGRGFLGGGPMMGYGPRGGGYCWQ